MDASLVISIVALAVSTVFGLRSFRLEKRVFDQNSDDRQREKADLVAVWVSPDGGTADPDKGFNPMIPHP